MPVTPEDLVEAWHLVVASGDEPVEWSLGPALWEQVRRAAEIEGTPPEIASGQRALLGTPVTMRSGEDAGCLPVLFIRQEGMVKPVPITGKPIDLQ